MLKKETLLFFQKKFSAIKLDFTIEELDQKTLGTRNDALRKNLIEWVSEWEELSNKNLLARHLDDTLIEHPLQYLDCNATFGDIADYGAAEEGTSKIDKIRKAIFRPKGKSLQDELFDFRLIVASCYARIIGKEMNETFPFLLVVEQSAEDMPEQGWDLPIWFTEMELNIFFPYSLKQMTGSTTVAQLIDGFVDAKKKELLKQLK